MKRIFLIILVTILYLIFMRGVASQLAADFNYAYSQQLLRETNYPKALEFSQHAISQNPNEPRYYYGKAKVLLAQLPNASKDNILELLTVAEKVNPQNLVTLRNVAPFYYFLAVSDLQRPEGPQNLDQKFLPITTKFFENLSSSYPADAGVQVLVAKYEKKLGLTELYQAKLVKIRQLRPDLLEWYPELVVL